MKSELKRKCAQDPITMAYEIAELRADRDAARTVSEMTDDENARLRDEMTKLKNDLFSLKVQNSVLQEELKLANEKVPESACED